MYYDLVEHDTSTSRTHLSICSNYGINDLESRLVVIQGH